MNILKGTQSSSCIEARRGEAGDVASKSHIHGAPTNGLGKAFISVVNRFTMVNTPLYVWLCDSAMLTTKFIARSDIYV